MEVKRIANFSQEEIEKLQVAGTILGIFAKASNNGEFDAITPEAANLLEALRDVINRIIGE